MTDSFEPNSPHRSSTPEQFAEVDRLCDAFEDAWRAGEAPSLSNYVSLAKLASIEELFEALFGIELAYRQQQGKLPPQDEYVEQFPQFADLIKDRIR